MKALSTKVIAFAFVFIVFLIALAFGIAYVYGTTDIDFRELFGLGSVEEEWKGYEPVETTTETTTTIPPSGKCDIECKKLYFASGTCKDSCELGETRLDKSNGYDFQIRAADAHITAFLPDSKNYQPNAWGFVEDLGINALRLFTGGEGDIAHLNMKRYPNEWTENLNNFLSETDAHGVKVYFYELGTEWNTLLGIRPEDTTIEEAKSMIDKLAGDNNLGHDFINDDRILVWSVDNEPSISKNPSREEDYKRLEWILEISDYIRSKGGNKGGKTVVASPRLDDNWGRGQDFHVTEPIFRDHVDYLERHSYKSVEFYQTCVDTGNPFSFEDCYNKMYASYKKQLQEEMIDGKGSFSVDQLIFGEFGVWIGDSGTKSNQGCINCFFEDEHRRAYYKAVLDAARDVGIKNICFHNLFSRTSGPSWTENLIPDYGVVDVDGTYHDEELASIIREAYKTGESYCDSGYTCCCSPPPVESHDFKKFIVLYGSYQPSDEDLEYLASNFDFINTESGQGEDVANLKEMDPDIVVVFYKDLIGMYSYYSDWGEVDKHRDWFLHDTGGNRIINKNFGWYLMNPASDGWRNYYAGQVKDELDRNPQYDGVFADDCWGDFYNYFTVGDEKLPDITKEEWNNDINGMLKVIKDQIGDKLIIVNSNTPFDYMQYADGRMDESFAHAPWHGPNTFHTVGGWKEKIDALYQWSGNDKYLMANGGVEEGATDEEKESLMKFCLSSYLLGVNGPKALFGFKPPTKSGGYSWGVMDEWLHPEYERVGELGDPIGKYYSEGSIYFRDFENGKVIVNPSSATPPPINLDQNYKTLDGKIVSEVTLDDHSGIILLKIS